MKKIYKDEDCFKLTVEEEKKFQELYPEYIEKLRKAEKAERATRRSLILSACSLIIALIVLFFKK